jgi:hypothetical protein
MLCAGAQLLSAQSFEAPQCGRVYPSLPILEARLHNISQSAHDSQSAQDPDDADADDGSDTNSAFIASRAATRGAGTLSSLATQVTDGDARAWLASAALALITHCARPAALPANGFGSSWIGETKTVDCLACETRAMQEDEEEDAPGSNRSVGTVGSTPGSGTGLPSPATASTACSGDRCYGPGSNHDPAVWGPEPTGGARSEEARKVTFLLQAAVRLAAATAADGPAAIPGGLLSRAAARLGAAQRALVPAEVEPSQEAGAGGCGRGAGLAELLRAAERLVDVLEQPRCDGVAAMCGRMQREAALEVEACGLSHAGARLLSQPALCTEDADRIAAALRGPAAQALARLLAAAAAADCGEYAGDDGAEMPTTAGGVMAALPVLVDHSCTPVLTDDAGDGTGSAGDGGVLVVGGCMLAGRLAENDSAAVAAALAQGRTPLACMLLSYLRANDAAAESAAPKVAAEAAEAVAAAVVAAAEGLSERLLPEDSARLAAVLSGAHSDLASALRHSLLAAEETASVRSRAASPRNATAGSDGTVRDGPGDDDQLQRALEQAAAAAAARGALRLQRLLGLAAAAAAAGGSMAMEQLLTEWLAGEVEHLPGRVAAAVPHGAPCPVCPPLALLPARRRRPGSSPACWRRPAASRAPPPAVSARVRAPPPLSPSPIPSPSPSPTPSMKLPPLPVDTSRW